MPLSALRHGWLGNFDVDIMVKKQIDIKDVNYWPKYIPKCFLSLLQLGVSIRQCLEISNVHLLYNRWGSQILMVLLLDDPGMA